MVPFACPVCHRILSGEENRFTCDTCHREYPVADGIPRFAASDPFYEEARPGSGVYKAQTAQRPTGWKRVLFPVYRALHLGLRTRRFQDAALACSAGPILDAGCGGGNGHLAVSGDVTGIDISVTALKEARTVYGQAGQASLTALPFEDGVFGTIVCNHVLEHIPSDRKDGVLRELHRVLQPQGRLIAAVPVRGDNILYRRALGRPELFRKYFIEAVGHHGLEPPADLKARLAGTGFRILKMHSDYSVIWPPGTYSRFLGNEYRTDPFFSCLVRLDGIFTAAGPKWDHTPDKLINCGLGMASRIIDFFLPLRASSLVNICAVKD